MLLGNISAHFLKKRRTKALEKLNPNLKGLTEDEDYVDTQPFLFGKGFEKKTEERVEALECLWKATTKEQRSSHSSSNKRYFHGSCPQQKQQKRGQKLPPPTESVPTPKLSLPVPKKYSGETAVYSQEDSIVDTSMIIINPKIFQIKDLNNIHQVKLIVYAREWVVKQLQHLNHRSISDIPNELGTKVMGHKLELIEAPLSGNSTRGNPPTTGRNGTPFKGDCQVRRKGAVSVVHPPMREGFISRMFLVPKKGGPGDR